MWQASISEETGVQNPVNLATAYLDLDFVYGRSATAAEALRTSEGGLMSLSDSGIPLQNDDGTWLVSAPVFSVCERVIFLLLYCDAHL